MKSKKNSTTTRPSNHELRPDFNRSLEEAQITPTGVRDDISSRLPQPGRIDLEVGRAEDLWETVGAGAEAAWRIPLYGREDEQGVRDSVEEDTRRTVLRLVSRLAQAHSISLDQACTVMYEVCRDSRKEVQRRRNEQEVALDKSQRRLDKLGRQVPESQEDRSGGLLGTIFNRAVGFTTDISDQVEAARRWMDREKELRRLDVQDTNLYVWTSLCTRLQKLPASLQQAEARLKNEIHSASISLSPDTDPTTRLPDVVWEPAGDLAACFTETEAAPLLPAQLLVTLDEERWDEVGGLIETASREQPATLSLINAMKSLHPEEELQEGGSLILQVIKQEVGERTSQPPLIYQVGEKGAGGQVHTLWPAVASQTKAVAFEGAAPFLGYLLLEPPVTVDAVRTALPEEHSRDAHSYEFSPSANGRRPAAATV
jgi:hypothetical protein